MKIAHIILNEDDRMRVERVMRFLPDEFEHQFVTPAEIGSVAADLVHAHCWFGCGAAARQVAAETHKPYLVEIVQDDLQKYHKLLFFSRKTPENLLSDAARVVFTAPVQQNELAKRLPSKIADDVFAKSMLLYEPLPDFWLEQLHIHPPTALIDIKLLYVGPLTDDSRLGDLMHAMHKLHRRNYSVSLTVAEDVIVEGSYRKKMLREVNENDFLRAVSVESDEELREIYRHHDILWLPDADTTKRYAEALSQGLPVIYGHDSVADGIFKDGLAGYSVKVGSSDEIARSILSISDFFGTIEQQIMRLHPLNLFDAREQAQHWVHLYENAVLNA